MIEEILAVDWDQVRLKRALSGVVAMLLVVAFIGVAGKIVLTVALATLFTIAAGGDGAMSERWKAMAKFVVSGAVVGGLAFWSVETAVAVAAVLGAATYLGTLAAAWGPRFARSGLFLTLWALIAVILGSADTAPLAVSGAFAIGGAIAIGVTALRLAVSSEDDAADDTSMVSEGSPDDAVAAGSGWERLVSAFGSPIGTFALIRTTAVVVAVLLGFWWFSSYPLWAASTVIIVVRPSSSQTASVAIQRTLGTAIGAAVAILVAQRLPESLAGVVVAFLISAFLMIAFLNANYTLFATFLTAMLVFMQRIAQADAFEAGWERLLATGTGGLVAFGAVVLAMAYRSRSQADRG